MKVSTLYVCCLIVSCVLVISDQEVAAQPFIDPMLEYATFLGGMSTEDAFDVAVDPDGFVYITGYTDSVDFPATPDAYDTDPNGPWDCHPTLPCQLYFYDVFVAKIDVDANEPVYVTYIGGDYADSGTAIAVDELGHAYVTGWTESGRFPVNNPYQETRGGSRSAFVLKLTAPGDDLIFSTYLGGRSSDSGLGIAVHEDRPFIAGITTSTDFPTQGAAQPSLDSAPDAFIAKLSASGSELLYGTYLGGEGLDGAADVAVSLVRMGEFEFEAVTVTGWTDSVSSFPVSAGAFQRDFGGGRLDGFVTRALLFAAAPDTPTFSSSWLFSTYLGGSDRDLGGGIALDALGRPVIVGGTRSTNFPTRRPYQAAIAGPEDGFVAQFDATASNLVFSTYLGGAALEYLNSVAVDKAGIIYAGGYTSSTDFPTISPTQPTMAGAADSTVSVFAPGGSPLLFSTYYGGPLSEWTGGIAFWRRDRDPLTMTITIAGASKSDELPMSDIGFQPTNRSVFPWQQDTFIARWSIWPVGLPCGSISGERCPPCYRCVLLDPDVSDSIGICVYDPSECTIGDDFLEDFENMEPEERQFILDVLAENGTATFAGSVIVNSVGPVIITNAEIATTDSDVVVERD